MPFSSQTSVRIPGTSYFTEMFVCDGPEIVGDTQDQLYEQLYGWSWVATRTDDGSVEFYQWNPTSGQLNRVITNMPSIPVTKSSRRLSMAFDQSARALVAYEIDGLIYVIHWDSLNLEYVADITFAGYDPILYNDVLLNRYVPESDVICFYTGHSDTLNLRYQRDDYDTEYDFTLDSGSLPAGFVIDRVVGQLLKWQVLASDSDGVPLDEMPTSDLYPYYTPLPTLEGTASYFAALRSIVRSILITIPSIEGTASYFAALRSTVRIIEVTLPTLEGTASYFASLSTIVQRILATLPTLEGTASYFADLDTIVERVISTLPTLEGTASYFADLETV